jgi:cytochrome d ubiquinol oxidase subunit I
VVVSGVGGTSSVVAANAWMNRPGGYTMRDGQIIAVRPLEVLFTDAFWYEAVHMLLAAYMIAGFTIAGVYAVGMLRGRRDRYHRLGLLIPLTVAALATPVQVFVGDVAAREVYHQEPAKFAAIEALDHTGTHVPEILGGYYDDGDVHWGLKIPSGASLLSGYKPSTEVKGLNEIPAAVAPTDREVTIVHLCFDVMVGIGFALLALAAWYGWYWWRRRDLPRTPWFYRATAVSGLASVVALEAGWVTTEVGRQPWTVVGVLLTRDAVTKAGNLWLLFTATLVLYVAVGVTTFFVLRILRRRWRDHEGTGVPYGPEEAVD